jgi:hypothetical protein
MQDTRTPTVLAFLAITCWVVTVASAGSSPVVDSFTATPQSAVPGQSITLRITAHDPDCTAPPCTAGCGAFIRGELVAWADDSRRGSGAFTASSPGSSASPWSGTVTWIAPPADGIYQVYSFVSDSGDSNCGGRRSATAVLPITVSSAPIPIVESLTVTPGSVPVGAAATARVVARDPLGRAMAYAFSADAGTIVQASSADSTAIWTAPPQAGTFAIRCKVSADGGLGVTGQTMVSTRLGEYLRTIEIAGARPTRIVSVGDSRFVAADGASGALLGVDAATAKISWKQAGLRAPVAVVVLAEELFVLERDAKRISVWSKDGKKLREILVDAELPNQIAAGPGVGELSIVDTAAARVIVVSAADGRALRNVGVGALKVPTGISIANGRIAVADSGLARIALFEESGAVRMLGSSTIFVRPQGVMWDSTVEDRLIVTDSYSGEVIVLSAGGAIRGTLGGFGEAASSVINPIDSALLPGGVLAVTTSGGAISMFRLLATLPTLAPPVNVTAADQPNDDGGAVRVSWMVSPDDPGRVTGYRVERATGDAEAFEPMGRVGAGTTSYIDATVVDGRCHRYRVVAGDGTIDAPSDATDCVSSRNDLPPAAPAGVIAEAESPLALNIAWTPVPAPDLAGYVIELTASGATVLSVRAPRDAQRATAGSLRPETSYSISVRAIDTAANASGAALATATTWPDDPPPAPIVSASSADGGGAADLKWTIEPARVPVAKFRVTCTPGVAGWPIVTGEATASPLRVGALVNGLAYSVTVIAETPWGRSGAGSSPVSVTPVAPLRAVPVVERLGWDGSDGMEDAAGFAATFALEAEKRELRFQYRAAGGARLQIAIDGEPAGLPLESTDGLWKDGRVEIAKRLLKFAEANVIEVRNVAFPDPHAQLAVRRFDFVPLAQKDLKSEAYNTVIDLVWTWQESRRDLLARLVRAPERAPGAWEEVPCLTPRSGRCRDVLRANGEKFVYRLNIVSPAGWESAPDEVKGEAKYDSLPPPVTDLVVEPDFFPDGMLALKLTWTPVSTSVSKAEPPGVVLRYRIYRSEAGRLTELGEAEAPPALVARDGFDSARHTLVIRSVDAQGTESP